MATPKTCSRLAAARRYRGKLRLPARRVEAASGGPMSAAQPPRCKPHSPGPVFRN